MGERFGLVASRVAQEDPEGAVGELAVGAADLLDACEQLLPPVHRGLKLLRARLDGVVHEGLAVDPVEGGAAHPRINTLVDDGAPNRGHHEEVAGGSPHLAMLRSRGNAGAPDDEKGLGSGPRTASSAGRQLDTACPHLCHSHAKAQGVAQDEITQRRDFGCALLASFGEPDPVPCHAQQIRHHGRATARHQKSMGCFCMLVPPGSKHCPTEGRACAQRRPRGPPSGTTNLPT